MSATLNLFDDARSAGVVHRDAVISDCSRYRYSLCRSWAPDVGTVLFVMLNPSTADAREDDPTIRRCIGFARSWGYGRIDVVNLFAWRATNPEELRGVADPIGPNNDGHILSNARAAKLVVCAWGAHGEIDGRDETVVRLLRSRVRVGGQPIKLHILGLTKGAAPRHPLYVRGDVQPERWLWPEMLTPVESQR